MYVSLLNRFPITTGVAGHVARTGQLLNISSVQDSEHFNPRIDEMTGYTTNTLLCAPLTVRGKSVTLMYLNRQGVSEILSIFVRRQFILIVEL